MPGVKFSFSQPIEMRVNELVAGVKLDVAVIIYGDDLDVLRRKAEEVARVLAQVPGAADVQAEQTARPAVPRVIIDREAIARYGIKAADVLDVVEALGGTDGRESFEGQTALPDPGAPRPRR